MRLNFQQGIITYPNTGSPSFTQTFLTSNGGGISASLLATSGRVDVAFAHGNSNYLFTETSDALSGLNPVWTGITSGVDTWLYWDLSLNSPTVGVRTFGFTTLAPLFGTTFPALPASDQHFFNLSDKKMYVFNGSIWRVVVRVFAAKVNSGIFTPLGSNSQTPYAGSQVGLTSFISVATGHLLVDDSSVPVRRPDGRFITTEDDIFVNGSRINTLRLEASVLTATALEPLSAYQVVKWSQFNQIVHATYFDLQNSAIAMLTENLGAGQTGTVITQGTVTNPNWNWPTVGALLWIDKDGLFVSTNPHVTDIVTYPIDKSPVARVVAPTTIIFDQNLTSATPTTNTVDFASTTLFGITKLSVAPVSAINPIAVGDNDPRLSALSQPSNQVMFGTGSSFTSDPDFTYVATDGTLYVNTTNGTSGSVSAAAPGKISLFAADNTTALGAGGTIALQGGVGGAGGSDGNVKVGRGTTSTTRAGDFLFIPTSAGVPTGTPTDVIAGWAPIVYDTTGHVLYTYSTGLAAWVGSSGGGSAPIKEIVFGTGPSVTSDADFTWDLTTNVLTIGSIVTPGTISGADGSSSVGAAIIVEAGDGDGVGNAGGSLTLRGGTVTDGNAGGVAIVGRAAVGTNRNGGVVTITAGAPSGTGTAGTVTVSTSGGYMSQRGGNFSVVGDAQSNMYVLRTSTSNNTLTEMFLDGPSGSRRMIIPIDTTWHFEANVVARRTDLNNDSAGYRLVGVIHNNAGTVSVVGGVTQSVDAEVSAAWDVTVDADNVNKALRIQVLGENGKSVFWVAFVRTVEVTG